MTRRTREENDRDINVALELMHPGIDWPNAGRALRRYAGLESGFQDAVGIAFQLVVLVFIVGLLVVGRRARGPGTRAAST